MGSEGLGQRRLVGQGRLYPGGSSQCSTSSATQGSRGVGGSTEKGTSVLSQFRKALAFELDFEDLGGACWMENGIKNVLKLVKVGSGSAVGSGSWCRAGWRQPVSDLAHCLMILDFSLEWMENAGRFLLSQSAPKTSRYTVQALIPVRNWCEWA